MTPNVVLGVGETPLDPCPLAGDQIQLAMQDALSDAPEIGVSAVGASEAQPDARVESLATERWGNGEPPSPLSDESVRASPPEDVVVSFNEEQRATFICMWSVFPTHMRDAL